MKTNVDLTINGDFSTDNYSNQLNEYILQYLKKQPEYITNYTHMISSDREHKSIESSVYDSLRSYKILTGDRIDRGFKRKSFEYEEGHRSTQVCDRCGTKLNIIKFMIFKTYLCDNCEEILSENISDNALKYDKEKMQIIK